MTDLIVLKDWIALQIELWRPIAGFPGYEISSKGRVRSFWTKRDWLKGNIKKLGDKSKILKLQTNRNGYHYIIFFADGYRRNCEIQRLVSKAFIVNDRIDIANDVNHKNNVHSDNRMDNLEWMTRQENLQHASRLGVMHNGELAHTSKLVNDQVLTIRRRFAAGETIKSISLDYPVGAIAIGKIVHRQRWTHI